MFKKFLLFMIMSFTILFASSLQDSIKKLKSAPPSQRYKIMNMIKIRLSKMNAQERAKNMQTLFKALKHKNMHQMQITDSDSKHIIHIHKEHINNKTHQEMKHKNFNENNYKQKDGQNTKHKHKEHR